MDRGRHFRCNRFPVCRCRVVSCLKHALATPAASSRFRDPPRLVPYGMVEKIDIATVPTLRRSADNLWKSLRRGCANAVHAALIFEVGQF